MTSPIEFALLAGLALAAFTFYKAQTTNMALNAREAMTDDVCKILGDPNAPEQLKLQAIYAFHCSAQPSFFLRATLYKMFRNNERVMPSLSGEHQQVLRNLIRIHFQRVNMLAAPHFYLLFWLLTVTTVLCISLVTFGQKSGFRYFQKTEELIINPPLRDQHC